LLPFEGPPDDATVRGHAGRYFADCRQATQSQPWVVAMYNVPWATIGDA
jgi:hypothetical protein